MFYPAGIESRRGGTPALAGRKFFPKNSENFRKFFRKIFPEKIGKNRKKISKDFRICGYDVLQDGLLPHSAEAVGFPSARPRASKRVLLNYLVMLIRVGVFNNTNITKND